MTSGPDVLANLAAATALLEEAAARGARVALLPENFAFMGLGDADKRAVAEAPGDGPIQRAIAQAARRLSLWVVAGTMPLRGAPDGRVAAACLVYDERGAPVGRYDKIHLFDVDIPGKAESYRESAHVAPGTEPVVLDTPAGRLGLAVCYDVRFPELFRTLSARGAEWFVLPSAFTVPTGRAHWEALLRARAIENLAFVVAAAQCGVHPGGRETWGDTMIVDYWGAVLARLPAGTGVVVADLDRAAQSQARTAFPSLRHRRIA
jgi:nitrilase